LSEKEFWVPPREANILITGRCNLKCRHCSVSSFGRSKDDLPLNAWSRILDELVSNKLVRVTVSGGEPMARPDFSEFITALASRPLRVAVNTNATMVSESAVTSLKKLESRLETVMVSIDGSNEKTHDSQRGTGAFRAMQEGVRSLRERGIPFGFYCTVTSLNVDDLSAVVRLAESLGGQWIKFNSFLYAGPELESSLIPEENHFRRAVDELETISAKANIPVRGTLLDMRRMVRKHRAGKLKPLGGKAYICGGGSSKIAVFPDGSVTPCDHLPEYILGNLTRSSLRSILHSPKMKAFAEFVSQPRANRSTCAACEFLDVCSGGCPVEALLQGQNPGFDRHSCLKLALKGQS